MFTDFLSNIFILGLTNIVNSSFANMFTGSLARIFIIGYNNMFSKCLINILTSCSANMFWWCGHQCDTNCRKIDLSNKINNGEDWWIWLKSI